MKYALNLVLAMAVASCGKDQIQQQSILPNKTEQAVSKPSSKTIWVFIMAGQSNMVGRAIVEAKDTLVNGRIMSLDSLGSLIYAKEPLHFYEPARKGLDCGVSFASEIIKQVPDSVSVLLVPTAVGGTSIEQWIGDSKVNKVKLFTNFKKMFDIGKSKGMIKGILWHQGETNATESGMAGYEERLKTILSKMRDHAKDETLPIIIGELGSFSGANKYYSEINKQIHTYSASDKYLWVVSSAGLKDRGDRIHFNSEAQRELGKRFAKAYLSIVNVARK